MVRCRSIATALLLLGLAAASCDQGRRGAVQPVGFGIRPAAPSIPLGASLQLRAVATYADGEQLDIGARADWHCVDDNVASVDANGLATGRAIGTTTITATDRGTGRSHSVVLIVTPAVVTAVAVTPAAPQIAAGTSQQFTAMATYSDATKADLTATVTWNSTAPGVASVGTSGLATSFVPGTTTIEAVHAESGVVGETVLTVTPAVLVSLAVTPALPSIALGTGQQFVATGTYSDNTTQDLTSAVTWSSSATGIATISNAPGSEGLASSAAQGDTTIRATDPGSGIFGETVLTVTPAVLVSLAVTPALPSIALGTGQQFVATGTYSDNTTQDLTSAVTWSSSATGIATISNAPGSEGLASSAAQGDTTIRATDPGSGIFGETVLTVTPAVLVSLAVTPALPSIALGTDQQFTATGTYSDSTTQDLTSAVTWSSSATGIATISNAPGSEGLASSAAQGDTTIRATDPGSSIFGETVLTVTPAVLVSLAVTPALPSIALGTDQQFTATGTYSDSTTQDLTSAVTWSSSATGIATISNAPGSEGFASSAAQGDTTIRATDPGSGIFGETVLTVTPAVLVSLAVTPALPSIALGTDQQFTATGTYSDSTTQDLTSAVTWSSPATGIATISNAPGSEGLASSAAQGDTTIRATDPGSGIFGETVLTVTPAVLVSIVITPEDGAVAVAATRQFTAKGIYSDSTAQDLTTAVTWDSSDAGIATISNAGGSEGLATGIGAGTATITALHAGSGVAGTTTLTVFTAIEPRSSASAGAGPGAASLTIATPAGTAAGDLLLAALAVRPSSVAVTPPAGWTLVRRIDNGASAAHSLVVYRRLATASEAADHTWTISSPTGVAGGIACFQWVDPASPVDVENGQTTSSGLLHAAPSVTSTVANAHLVTVHAFSSSATWTSPAAMNEVFDVASGMLGATGISLSMHSVSWPTAGATGSRTATASNDADVGTTATVVLRRL